MMEVCFSDQKLTWFYLEETHGSLTHPISMQIRTGMHQGNNMFSESASRRKGIRSTFVQNTSGRQKVLI